MIRHLLFLSLFISLQSFACEEISLPETIADYIASENLPFVARKLKFPSDYEDAPGYEKYTCQLVSDFNGDNKPDYAAFLFDTSKNGVYSVLFISTSNSYQHQLIEARLHQPNQIWAGFYLLKPGKHQHWNEMVEIYNPGIGYEIFEKPCCRYYWANNVLKELENDG